MAGTGSAVGATDRSCAGGPGSHGGARRAGDGQRDRRPGASERLDTVAARGEAHDAGADLTVVRHVQGAAPRCGVDERGDEP